MPHLPTAWRLVRPSSRVALALGALLCACDPIPGADAGPDAAPADAGPDASPLDAGADAGLALDAAPEIDAGTDAALDLDAGSDAGPPCECTPSSECVTATCVDGACVETPVANGTPCMGGAPFRCIAGACTDAVACGDGYREPGPAPAREACDDGNLADGDACDAECLPTVLVIQSRATEFDVPAHTAAAADDTGRLLFVFTASDGEDLLLLARRVDAAGVPIDAHDAPLTLATGLGLGWDPHAVVVGLATGWAVAWSTPNGGEEADIRVARVAADGTIAAPRLANEDRRGARRAPAIARLGAGFHLAWVDESGLAAGFGNHRIEQRTFTATGAPATAVSRLDSALDDAPTSARELTLASTGAQLLAAWTVEPTDFADTPTVRARRLGAGADATSFLVAEGASSSVAPLRDGSFAVAFVSRAIDPQGDVHVSIVPAAGPAASATPVAAASAYPELAPRAGALTATDLAITYEDGGRRRGLALALVALAASDPAELPLLTPEIQDGLQGDATLLRTDRGLWLTWSDASLRHGDPAAYRSTLTFLLAVD